MTIATNTVPIQAHGIYHIYNRAVGKEKLFLSGRDYIKFLEKIKVYILPHADIYAYCLLPNHFHFLVHIKDNPKNFSKAMADACNAHTKYFNITYRRRGGLFMSPFKRRYIEDDAALSWITWYIHRNPMHHHLTDNWQEWAWSSFKAYTGNFKTVLQTSFLIDFFGDRSALIRHHQINMEGWRDREME